MVETLGFSLVLNLENDTKSYTSHSSIFLGLIMTIFQPSPKFGPILAIFKILGDLWKSLFLRAPSSSISTIFQSLCVKDLDFGHFQSLCVKDLDFGHFQDLGRSLKVFVLRTSISAIFKVFVLRRAVVETLAFFTLLNLENDTDFYTSHSSIFLGIIETIFCHFRPLAPTSSISPISVNFGPWSKLWPVLVA